MTSDPFNAFIHRLDAPRRTTSGPLSDLVFSVKDNIVVDGLPTTGASPVFKDLVLPENGGVSRLIAAGAGFVGKTNLHELAFGITGANAHSGDTLNPFNTERLAGGSSAGAAVSVAAGICDFALGTDTGGSCRIPAAHCGVVGYRPSIGRYPGGGVLTLSPTRDTVGVLAKDMATLSRVDAVMAGQTAPVPADAISLGCVDEGVFFPIQDPAMMATYHAALETLREAGVSLKAADVKDVISAHDECGFAIAVYESAKAIGALAKESCGLSYEAFVTQISSEDVRGLFAMQADEAAVPKAAYNEAMHTHLPALRGAFERSFAEADVDLLVYPTVLVSPVKVESGETMTVAGEEVPVFPATTATTGPDSTAGLPSITLPCGMANGLPVGLMLVARIGADAALMAAALRVEALLGDRL